MSLSLHNLQSPNKKIRKRIGRGNGSGTGTYAGKGLKGQRSRSGVSGLKLKGLRARLMSIPKLRGFSSDQEKKAVVNLKDLENKFESGATISPKVLKKKGLIKTPRYGVKILGDGQISKSFVVTGCKVSAKAKEQIENAGGRIE